MSEFGAYFDVGGEIITFEWEPDPALIEQQLMGLAGYLENMLEPMYAAKRVAQDDITVRFEEQQSAPGGALWEPLTVEYYDWKESVVGGNLPILTLNGALSRQAASDSAWKVEGTDLWFDAGALPEYGLYHEVGTDGGTTSIAAALTASGAPSHESRGIGRGKGLPARPFIGLSDEAIAKIEVIFDMWIDAGLSKGLYIRESGVAQTRVAGGRFGPKTAIF